MLTVAIITDIHFGPDMGTKKGTAAPELLPEFVNFVTDRQPDYMVDLGDRVNHVDPDTDKESLTTVAEFFKQISCPKAHIIGNHDIDFLTVDDNEQILGSSLSSRVETVNGYSLIFWNANTYLDKEEGFNRLPQSDIEWLRSALEDAEYPTVIFSHVPLNNGSVRGNFYFDDKAYPLHAFYPDEQGKAIREAIERSGNVIACINGHTHWNHYHCIDGVHYLTIPSLTEMYVTYPEPNNAWAWLQLEGDSIKLEIYGNSPVTYTLKARQKDHHWVSKWKDYTPVKIDPK